MHKNYSSIVSHIVSILVRDFDFDEVSNTFPDSSSNVGSGNDIPTSIYYSVAVPSAISGYNIG